MEKDIIRTLTSTFEAHAQQTDGGVEFWLARDVQHLLGYTEWRNFTADKMVDLGSKGDQALFGKSAEDVKRVERRLASEQKRSLKNPESLDS